MKKLIFLLLPLSVFAQKKALFLGNSYTFYNQLPNMVVDIANSLGDTLIVDSNTPGGWKFQNHAETGSSSLQKIQQDEWDFVILQAQSQEPSFPPGQVQQETYPYATALVNAIKDHSECAEPLFFMTWGRKNGDNVNGQFYPIISTYGGMQQRLRESYLEMATTNGATVAPVGMAWQQVVNQYPDIELYTNDESHPSLFGSYLAACVFYTTIFEQSCADTTTYVPNGISQEIATTLQTIASNTVLDSTEVWNMFYAQSVDTTRIDVNTFEFEVQATNYDSLSWYFEPSEMSNQPSASHTFSQAGNFEVLLTLTSNGCREKTYSFNITVEDTTVAIVIPTLNGKEMTVYPTLANQHITITGNEQGVTFKLYDQRGRVVMQSLLKGDAEERIDISQLPKGQYLVEVTNKEQLSTYKIIKYD